MRKRLPRAATITDFVKPALTYEDWAARGFTANATETTEPGMQSGGQDMRLVIIESPYAGTSKWAIIRWFQRHRNIRYARACVRDSLLRGEAPICSHLLYTQRGILDDNCPVDRELGIEAGLAWRRVADASVFYLDHGMSKGMEMGKRKAHGLPIEIRNLYRTRRRPF